MVKLQAPDHRVYFRKRISLLEYPAIPPVLSFLFFGPPAYWDRTQSRIVLCFTHFDHGVSLSLLHELLQILTRQCFISPVS